MVKENADYASNPYLSYEMRDIVFDYLYHSGYVSTSRAFLDDTSRTDSTGHYHKEGVRNNAHAGPSLTNGKEGASSADVLRPIEQRKEIIHHILCGRIAEARTLLDRYFPSVLSRPFDSSKSIPHSSLYPSHNTTLNPTHLSLNLRIHAFIEQFRTRPLHYPSPPPASPDAAGDRVSMSLSRTVEDLDAFHEQLLIEAQRLYHEASQLEDDADRVTYQREMTNVGGLLAYNVPEDSPMAKYLTQERRQAVADQINAAILYQVGLPPVSKLDWLVKQTSLVFSKLNEAETVIPPPSKRPANVYIPSSAPLARNRKGKEDIQEYVSLVQPFNMQRFLEDRFSNSENAS